MEHDEQVEREVALRSAITYAAISVAAAVLFFVAATLKGGYPDVARLGGAIWVFVLAMIVTMPLVTSWFKQRYRRG
jgi:hypothetical protein